MSTFHPLRANDPSKGKYFGQSHMRELVQFLGRCAAGDENNCPAELDPLWHRCIAFPQAYAAFCMRRFGVVIEHVIDDDSRCYGQVTVQSIAGSEHVSSDKAPCKGRVRM